MRLGWNGKQITTVLGVAVLLTVAGPAMAQIESKTHEVHGYLGYVFGGDLTDSPVSGETPQLDDDFVVGLRYGYNFTKTWGIEAALGFNPNTATDLPGPDSDLALWTADVDAIWHFKPESRLVPFLAMGVGYTQADLENPITGTVDGQAVTIEDDSGFSVNLGVGLKYFATEHLIIRADARYRYLDSLVDPNGESINSIETTVGMGWRF